MNFQEHISLHILKPWKGHKRYIMKEQDPKMAVSYQSPLTI